ncbi:ABC transporter ATP-binding protein YtrB [Candidatus Izimaplasma bacterium HR1]|uniref:ABC transporter ATP-binding protein n=1 Tax=Candidatus Izimoplasma sp. HR1 TaxID=1541959 RepID=UPI0004F80E35|nr:ABC transporter ATP-binding protein YtrB [Candidatus Izimaplasma bacterium HR1]
MDSLVVENLTKTYEKFKLDNISFSIPKGYIMGFIGENGAGKTTTINALLNVIKKDSGTVTVFGKNIDEHELELKKNIGFVSGDSFYLKSKVNDITDVYKRFFTEWDNNVYQEYLKKFDLDPTKRLEELSKGMKMKYSIALALSHHAELLILDEPTSGLDPVARDGLLELFQSLVEDGNVSILFSTHITSDLEKCADYITFIQKGKMIESSSKDDLIDKYRLVNGTVKELDSIKSKLISYKTNAFGFNGLIQTDKVVKSDSIRYGQPSLDDIMIYYANKEEIK